MISNIINTNNIKKITIENNVNPIDPNLKIGLKIIIIYNNTTFGNHIIIEDTIEDKDVPQLETLILNMVNDKNFISIPRLKENLILKVNTILKADDEYNNRQNQ